MSNDNPSIHEICEKFLGPVDWKNTFGYCKCPGAHKHTTGAPTKKECLVYTNGVPTVYCFHNHCLEEINNVNREIREVWGLYQPEIPKSELEKAKEEAYKKSQLETKGKAILPYVLEKHAWPVDSIASSWSKTPYEGKTDWQIFMRLFKQDDIIWVGDMDSTGKYWHAVHFRRVAEWQHLPKPEHCFTCPNTFKRNIVSRANDNVQDLRYLVVESDNLIGKVAETDEEKAKNKDLCGAIFKWLKDEIGLSLRMVVDSGNKSLHGWFDIPEPSMVEELKVLLPAMGCDRALFKPSQPVRVPDGTRKVGEKEVIQKILYFNENAKV